MRTSTRRDFGSRKALHRVTGLDRATKSLATASLVLVTLVSSFAEPKASSNPFSGKQNPQPSQTPGESPQPGAPASTNSTIPAHNARRPIPDSAIPEASIPQQNRIEQPMTPVMGMTKANQPGSDASVDSLKDMSLVPPLRRTTASVGQGQAADLSQPDAHLESGASTIAGEGVEVRIEKLSEVLIDINSVRDILESAGFTNLLDMELNVIDPGALFTREPDERFGDPSNVPGHVQDRDDGLPSSAPPSGWGSTGGLASLDGDDKDPDIVEKVEIEEREGGRIVTVSRGDRDTGVVTRDVVEDAPEGGSSVSEIVELEDGTTYRHWEHHDAEGNVTDQGDEVSDRNGATAPDSTQELTRREWHRRGGADGATENPGDDATASERAWARWLWGKHNLGRTPGNTAGNPNEVNPEGPEGSGAEAPSGPRINLGDNLVVNPNPESTSVSGEMSEESIRAGQERLREGGRRFDDHVPAPAGE